MNTKQDWYALMHCDLPEQKHNGVEIKRFVVSEDEARMFNITQSMQRTTNRSIRPGTYTKLLKNGCLWMSDTPAEVRDHIPALRNASGICLITGLGLGCVAKGMLEKKNCDDEYAVEKLIVLEKDVDIVNVVGVALHQKYGDRLEVRLVDALEYKPPKKERYQCVWHDIWTYICLDNQAQITELKKRYKYRTIWIGAWSEDEIKRLRYKRRNRGRS